MVVPEHGELHEGWLTRVMRICATRADLELTTAEQPESGFSPAEAKKTSSVCASAGSRASWCRAPISLYKSHHDRLVMVFAGAGHSRLVVYNDTLDDPSGMVHIRDLLASRRHAVIVIWPL